MPFKYFLKVTLSIFTKKCGSESLVFRRHCLTPPPRDIFELWHVTFFILPVGLGYIGENLAKQVRYLGKKLKIAFLFSVSCQNGWSPAVFVWPPLAGASGTKTFLNCAYHLWLTLYLILLLYKGYLQPCFLKILERYLLRFIFKRLLNFSPERRLRNTFLSPPEHFYNSALWGHVVLLAVHYITFGQLNLPGMQNLPVLTQRGGISAGEIAKNFPK